ncbi:MAG: aminotransferase class I/II-fold pyridoxal phosphate-dependent enzyme [Gammaproteobacteria bacterium]|nr:aminotransferase class I/II-fold pyridoxal phosphate-dependent enzyme [Gammaproteobacteria bacterium]
MGHGWWAEWKPMPSPNRQERLLRRFERDSLAGAKAGVFRVRVEDRVLRGETITINGRELLNFGMASYLGLNLDPRLKAGAIDAISRYGPVYSSSTAFTALPLYTALEERLERMFEGHVVIAPTTTLAHLAALPLIVPTGSDILIDAQAHESLRLTGQILQASGSSISAVPHNDMEALADAVEQSSAASVWYLADGVYSMFGDLAPVREISALMDRFPNLHVYLDDAHGFGWAGEHGRGYVLGQVPIRERMVVAGSLSKSIGAGGGALVFPDEKTARRVRTLGGTMTFSGPLHPAELGAAIVSADIHLSSEYAELQARLLTQIELTRGLLAQRRLPVVEAADSPVWFIRIGTPDDTIEVAKRLQSDGFYVNPSGYPAVPIGSAGVRFSNSLYLRDEAFVALTDALARRVPEVVGDTEIVIDLTEKKSPHIDPLQR